MILKTRSEADTMELASRLSPMLRAGDTVLLYGDLGAGKSVFARGIARGMGICEAMPSPTFTLLRPYVGEGGRKLYHFDLYRLADADEYYAAGLDEFIGGDGVAVVEWPQMADVEPEPSLTVILERSGDDDARLIEIVDHGVAGFDPAALEAWEVRT